MHTAPRRDITDVLPAGTETVNDRVNDEGPFRIEQRPESPKLDKIFAQVLRVTRVLPVGARQGSIL